MKKIILLTIVMLLAALGAAQAETKVSRIAVAKEIIDREPVEVNNIFQSVVDKLYCFTEITTDQAPTVVVHIWQHEGKTMAEVPLEVGGSQWRTYSSKSMIPAWHGHWRVEIHAEDGALLEAAEFIILE